MFLGDLLAVRLRTVFKFDTGIGNIGGFTYHGDSRGRDVFDREETPPRMISIS